MILKRLFFVADAESLLKNFFQLGLLLTERNLNFKFAQAAMPEEKKNIN